MPASIELAGDRSATSSGHPAIEQELQRILESEFFSRSSRSRSFLQYVVEAALLGKTEDLKERTLGVAIFDRDPSYDTGEDAIVRVKANEIRRRLAQFNAQPYPEQLVRIELPAGSYCPQFHWLTPPEAPLSVTIPLPKKRSTAWIFGAAGAFFLLVAAGVALSFRNQPSALEKFWQPVLHSSQPAIICLGHPLVYILSTRVRSAAREKYGKDWEFGPTVPTFAAKDISGEDIIPAADQFAGVGDAQCAFLMGTYLRTLHKTSTMRVGSEVPFSDLRDSPMILVGGFSNHWTMQISNQFRFVFAEDADSKHRRVVDRVQTNRFWTPPFFGAAGRVTEDFAIISRVIRSQSGQTMISAAGITQFGSQAAGELLSDPELFSKAVAGAPTGWTGKNMQIVVKTKIFGGSPGPPEVVATHFW